MSNEIVKKVRLKPSLEQIIEICRLYNIGHLISIMEEIENTVNANIRIMTDTGQYVIRIFSAEPQRFNFIFRTLSVLDNNHIPVLLPLKNIEGEHYSKIGSKMLQVTKFVNGYPFIYDRKQAWSSGRILRNFHDALIDIQEEVKPKASLYPSISTLKKGIIQLKRMKSEIPQNQLDLVINLYDEIVGHWEVKGRYLPKTIIHGDWHPRNQLFTESGEVSCVMDFDFITKAERIFDVAYALWYLRIYKESLSIAKFFLDGYGSLSNEEIHLLPLEIARINCFFICTSAMSLNPQYELNNQINQQYPFIKWALSKDGENTINLLCKNKFR